MESAKGGDIVPGDEWARLLSNTSEIETDSQTDRQTGNMFYSVIISD